MAYSLLGSCKFFIISGNTDKKVRLIDNKAIVTKFYQEVFQAGDLSHLDTYMRDDYLQHNSTVKDGKKGFREFITGFLKMQPTIEIINLSADHNMVYVFFKCTLANGHVNKVCDIYRLQAGQLAEHWDIIEHNVEKIQSVNNNGLF